MIIFDFLKAILLQLTIFLSFICPISLVQSEQKNEIVDHAFTIEKISNNGLKTNFAIDKEKNNKEKNNTVNYIIKIPEEIKTVPSVEEKKGVKYYFFKIMDKMSWLLEACFSGFLGIIGGYIAQKVIDQIDKDKEEKQEQEQEQEQNENEKEQIQK